MTYLLTNVIVAKKKLVTRKKERFLLYIVFQHGKNFSFHFVRQSMSVSNKIYEI